MYDNIEDNLDYYITQHTLFEDFEIVAFIENEEDERFWNFIFSKAIPNKKIAFNSYSRDGNQGKIEVLKYKAAILSKEATAIICVDSDFDYITDSKELTSHPYIFQTYTYSVENYSCNAKSLNNLRDTLLLKGFDFEIFLQKYSSILLELFILDIYLKEEKTNINNFYQELANKENLQHNGAIFLTKLQEKVDNKIIDLNAQFSIDIIAVQELKNKLEEDSLFTSTCLHLYINGHVIFNLMKDILSTLHKEQQKINIIKIKESFSQEKIPNKIKELQNKPMDIVTTLKMNFSMCYHEKTSLTIYKIIEDVKECYEQ